MLSRLGIAVATVVAGALVTPATPAATAANATYQVWQWNIAGNTMHDGSTTDGMVNGAVASILARDAQLVSLSEVCHGQYQEILNGLREAGWPEDSTNFARFAPSREPAVGLCNGHEEFGNAMFSKAPLGSADHFTLPSDGKPEQRNLLCAAQADRSHVEYCTTHITTSNDLASDGQPYNVKQLNYVLNQVESYHSAGQTVIISGDFNAQPNYGRLNNWYSSTLNVANNGGNTGHYRELDDNDAANCLGYGEWSATGAPGAPTPCGGNAKIDLTFVREDKIVGSYSADSLAISTSCTGIKADSDGAYPAGSCSDHRIVVGTVTVATD